MPTGARVFAYVTQRTESTRGSLFVTNAIGIYRVGSETNETLAIVGFSEADSHAQDSIQFEEGDVIVAEGRVGLDNGILMVSKQLSSHKMHLRDSLPSKPNTS